MRRCFKVPKILPNSVFRAKKSISFYRPNELCFSRIEKGEIFVALRQCGSDLGRVWLVVTNQGKVCYIEPPAETAVRRIV